MEQYSSFSDEIDIVQLALEAIGETNEHHIQDLQNTIIEKMRPVFDESSIDQKIRLATIHRLTADEIVRLIKREVSKGPIIGLHSVSDQIIALCFMTELNKYQNLCDTVRSINLKKAS